MCLWLGRVIRKTYKRVGETTNELFCAAVMAGLGGGAQGGL